MSHHSSCPFPSASNKRELRRLRISDAEAMHELESICFSMPWTRSQCKGALAQDNFAALGLWQGKALVAYISFFHYGEEMEIINLAVHPFARRRGHGFHLLQALLQAGRKMGMQRVALEVRENNQAAISLYEKSGFGISGLRKKYYPDTGENALIYTFNL